MRVFIAHLNCKERSKESIQYIKLGHLLDLKFPSFSGYSPNNVENKPLPLRRNWCLRLVYQTTLRIHSIMVSLRKRHSKTEHFTLRSVVICNFYHKKKLVPLGTRSRSPSPHSRPNRHNQFENTNPNAHEWHNLQRRSGQQQSIAIKFINYLPHLLKRALINRLIN